MTKISEATNRATLADTDMLPVAASGDNTAYKFTLATLLATIKGWFAALANLPFVLGANASVEGALTVSSLGAADWHVAADQATFEGRADDVLILGYNGKGVGQHDTLLDISWFTAFEADYQFTADPADRVCEWYVEYHTGNSENLRRPFFARVNRTTHACSNEIKGSVDFLASDGLSQSIKIQDSGADVISYVDLTFNEAADGVVLKDRTTGAFWRLKVDNGVLGIEAA